MTDRSRSPFALALALTATTSLIATSALAQEAASERPFYLGGGGGVALELDKVPTQAMLSQAFGWHLLSTTDGPFIGLSLAESFGNNLFAFQAAPRFGWDIALVRGDVGVLLAPSVAAGITYLGTTVTGAGASGSLTLFHAQGATDLKVLLLDDELELVARPIAIDVMIDDSGVAVRWNALAEVRWRF